MDSSGRGRSVTVTTPWGDTKPSDEWRRRSTDNSGEVYTGRSFSPNWPNRNCGTIGVPPIQLNIAIGGGARRIRNGCRNHHSVLARRGWRISSARAVSVKASTFHHCAASSSFARIVAVAKGDCRRRKRLAQVRETTRRGATGDGVAPSTPMVRSRRMIRDGHPSRLCKNAGA